MLQLLHMLLLVMTTKGNKIMFAGAEVNTDQRPAQAHSHYPA